MHMNSMVPGMGLVHLSALCVQKLPGFGAGDEVVTRIWCWQRVSDWMWGIMGLVECVEFADSCKS